MGGGGENTYNPITKPLGRLSLNMVNKTPADHVHSEEKAYSVIQHMHSFILPAKQFFVCIKIIDTI